MMDILLCPIRTKYCNKNDSNFYVNLRGVIRVNIHSNTPIFNKFMSCTYEANDRQLKRPQLRQQMQLLNGTFFCTCVNKLDSNKSPLYSIQR